MEDDDDDNNTSIKFLQLNKAAITMKRYPIITRTWAVQIEQNVLSHELSLSLRLKLVPTCRWGPAAPGSGGW